MVKRAQVLGESAGDRSRFLARLVDGKLPLDPRARRDAPRRRPAHDSHRADPDDGSHRAQETSGRRQFRRALPALRRGSPRALASRGRGDARAARRRLGRVRFLVWGTGAIGGTLGAFLARAGHDITLVDTASDHVDAINAHGLRITGPIANFTVPLTAQPPNRLTGSWDTIILATKAHHTRAAARALRSEER